MDQEFNDDDDYYRYGPYDNDPYSPGYDGYVSYGPGYGYDPYGYAPAPATPLTLP